MLTEHSNKNFKECVIEGFTFLYNNIRSATANLEDPEIFVAQFSLPCAVALTETWWKNKNDAELF